MRDERFGRAAGHLLIAALALLLPLLLYRARHLDDNSLTSWRWVFQAADPGWLFLLLVMLLPLCWLLAVIPDWRRSPSCFNHPAWRRLAPAGLAFAACLLFLDTPEVIVDAARYFVQAKSFSEYGAGYFFRQWGREIFAWTDLPLLSALYGLLFTVFGESRLAVQLLNALFFALTALLISTLGRDLWDEETGTAGALLFLGFPYLYSQVPLLLVDIGTMFFLLLAMVGLHRAMTRGGFFYPALTALAVLAVLLSKYSAWLLLSGLLPVFFCSLGRQQRRAVGRAALALLPALLAAALLFWLYREAVAAQIALLLEFQKPGLAGWSESLVSTFLFQTHPLLTAALLYSLYRAGRLRDWRYSILLWPVLLLLVWLEIRRIRYSIPLFPLLALLAAYGLRDLADPALRRHLLLVVAGSSLLLAWGGFLPFLQSMGERNLQQAGAYLDTLAVERAEVIVLPAPDPVMAPRVAVPLLDLFTRCSLSYQPLPELDFPAWAASSPLRFTWEMPVPPFYAMPEPPLPPAALVLIFSEPSVSVWPQLSEQLQNFGPPRRFMMDSGVFQHRTLVEVYGPPAPACSRTAP